MRRSSTTVSGLAMVLSRRYGEKLLQNSSDSTRPSAPATIRMIPTVLRLNPEVVTSTAKARMAPTTNRKILTQGSKLLASSRMLRQLTVRPSPACMGYLVGPCTRHCRYGSRHQRQGRAGAAGSAAGRERQVGWNRPCCQPYHAVDPDRNGWWEVSARPPGT